MSCHVKNKQKRPCCTGEELIEETEMTILSSSDESGRRLVHEVIKQEHNNGEKKRGQLVAHSVDFLKHVCVYVCCTEIQIMILYCYCFRQDIML